MSLALRAMGAVILLALALYIGKIYEKYCDRKLSEMGELLRMLLHIKEKISTFLCPQSSLLSDFQSDILEGSGFITAIREGKTLSAAFKSADILLPKEQRQRLEVFFNELGKHYKAEELSRIDSVYRELSECYKNECVRVPKDIKIAKTLLAAAALGISILMI